MPCSLEHDDFSFVSSSDTDDESSLIPFASRSPVQMDRKTSDRNESGLGALLGLPCA
jgi:hypothetical protein